MNRIIRISILADKYYQFSWNVIDWEDERTKILYKELMDSIENIYKAMSDSEETTKLLLTSSLDLGVDLLFSQLALDLQNGLKKDFIITQVAIPYLHQVSGYSELNKNRYCNITEHADIIVILSDTLNSIDATKKSRLWKIDNSDHLILVTEDIDSDEIRYARDKQVPILFIRPSDIEAIVKAKNQIFEWAVPLIDKNYEYAQVVIDSAREKINNYCKNLLKFELDFEEDKSLSKDRLLKKYSVLSLELARALIKFNQFILKDNNFQLL